LPPVGFIGLGVMGSALSRLLLGTGRRVIGYDVDESALAAHQANGGERAASVAEVAERTEILVTSLPTVEAFRAVVGGDGLSARPRPGLIVIEASTLPIGEKSLAQMALATAGITLLDSPMSGTGAQARRGDVVAFLSGPPAEKDIARPVLQAMTREVYDAGPFGDGTRLKFVANLLVAIHNVAAAEAIVLAEHAGLDLDLVIAAVSAGAGTSRMFEIRGPLMAAGRYEPATVRLEVFQKDIDIIAAYAQELGSPTPLLQAASTYYRLAQEQGFVGQDTASVVEVLRRLAT
jgi:putative dehydrogenase